MNSLRPNDNRDGVLNAEETLRLVARLPAPDGLAERVQASLVAPPQRSAFMNWGGLGRGWMYNSFLRGCAAAAIVVIVAGGGWSIYTRVPASPSAKMDDTPARVGPGGGFSNSGALRKPDTLNGPVLAHPAVPAQQNSIAPVAPPHSGVSAPKVKPESHKEKAVTAPRH